MTHIWLITHAIYISYDLKFYFWFSDAKIFEIRQRKIFQSFFTLECVGEIKFWLEIRIQRKISRRMICVDMGYMVVSYHYSLNIAFHAYAILIFMRIIGKIIIDLISTHTIRREILRWIRIWSQNFNSAHAFRRKFDFKFLRGQISKIFTSTESEIKFAILWYVYYIYYESYVSHRGFFRKMSHSSLL